MKTNKKPNEDEQVLSRNHGKNVKYRIRKVQEEEAEEEIKDFNKPDDDEPRVLSKEQD